jgi:signal transduction histidine kinase
MTSLRQGLTWSLGVGLSALFLLQWLAISFAFRHAAEDYLASRLEADTETLLAAVGFDHNGLVLLDPARVDPAFQRVFSGRYFTIVSADAGSVRSRSLWDTDLPAGDRRGGQRLRTRGPQDQRLLMVSKTYQLSGHPLVITVAEDVSGLTAGLHRFQVAYGAASLIVLVLLALLQRAVVGRALLPLERVRDELRGLHQGRVQRIEARAPSEIVPLVDELNGLLDVLGERLRRSREALGNLAHALKTHLAVLTQLLDGPEGRTHRGLARTLEGPVAAMSRLVERELKRARLAGGGVPGKQVSLSEGVSELVDALSKIYAHKNIRYEMNVADDLVFQGDREDLLELAGNVMDNACKWCKGRVRVGASLDRQLVLVVEDDGPGVRPDNLKLLAERGMRADESKPGSGLGLAIATEVARSYGGALHFEHSSVLGGLRVAAVLPGARQTTAEARREGPAPG